MSDDKNKTDLSPKEKATEALLRSAALPDSTVDRDLLMYQSGFNAALAQNGKATESPVLERKSSVVWPALTAAFATTAAICLVMLYFQQDSPQRELVTPAVLASSDEAAPSEPRVNQATELATRANPLKSLFGFAPEGRYRNRMTNTIRELEGRVTPASYESKEASLEDNSKPLTPGNSVNVDNLFDGLL